MPLALSSPEVLHSDLPPQDAWLINPAADRLLTPLDDRGFVDIQQLVEDVKATIDPAYVWNGRIDRHHFQWPNAWYSRGPEGDPRLSPHYFRELPVHKGDMPRDFHTWLHKITIPPPLPPAEAMEYRIEAWIVAQSLFRNMQKGIVTERQMRRHQKFVLDNPETLAAWNLRRERRKHLNPRLLELRAKQGIVTPDIRDYDEIAEEMLHDLWERQFGNLAPAIEKLEKIPSEFRLVEPATPSREMLTKLGRIVAPRAVQIRNLGIMTARAA